MKTITTTVYLFSELSADAKEKAREWARQSAEGNPDCVMEDAKQAFATCGVTIDKIHYSGFSSQGDGACFTGSWRAADVKPGAMKEYAGQDTELHRIAGEFERIAALFPRSSFSVKHSGHYQHENCTDFNVSILDTDGNEIETPEAIQADKDLIEAARDAMRWIYERLEADYEWANEDEQIDETIECNGYTFTVEGKRFG